MVLAVPVTGKCVNEVGRPLRKLSEELVTHPVAPVGVAVVDRVVGDPGFLLGKVPCDVNADQTRPLQSCMKVLRRIGDRGRRCAGVHSVHLSSGGGVDVSIILGEIHGYDRVYEPLIRPARPVVARDVARGPGFDPVFGVKGSSTCVQGAIVHDGPSKTAVLRDVSALP